MLDSVKLVVISFIVAALTLFAHHQLFHASTGSDLHGDAPELARLQGEDQRDASK